jgi:dihydrofolate reductase
MRQLIATEYVSLDGYMDEPGKWTMPFWSDEIGQFKYEELFAAEVQLLGRATYDGFAAAWPTMPGTGDFGERMNSMPKYVASRTRTEFDWNATGLTGDLVEAVTTLKAQDGGDILLAGSGQVFTTAFAAGLVDQLRLLVYPIVLNGELPLFRTAPRTALTLTDTITFSSGVVALTYTITGKD